MKKPRIYLETTIFNYYFDSERDGHAATVKLFMGFENGIFEAYTSEYTITELHNASEPKRSDMEKLIEAFGVTVLPITAESDRLANLYLEHGIIPYRYRVDAAHIAIASINNLDFVLSFNYKHINRVKTKILTEALNLSEGYKGIIISTPMEVVEDD